MVAVYSGKDDPLALDLSNQYKQPDDSLDCRPGI